MTASPELMASLLRLADRAPSAHNTQPWVPSVRTAPDSPATEVSVTVDPDCLLPFGDPGFEDLHLSLGCWVESLAIAAAEAGLRHEVTAVRGRGPSLEIDLRLEPGEDSVTGPADPRSRFWPRFTGADLLHRQVDRGPLARDDSAFASALGSMEEGLDAIGARLVVIPPRSWISLRRRANLHLFSDRRVLAETLDWLRLDPGDHRAGRDGLSAACLRLPPFAARLAHRLTRPGLRGPVTGLVALGLSPLAPLADSIPWSAPEPRTDGPHHLVLVDDRTAGGRRPQLDPARGIELGRHLLRCWLLLDRHGLRVDVHSEIKDCPATRARLRAHLGAGVGDPGAAEPASGPVLGASGGVPVAAFSSGRSLTSVPRSQRRRS